MTKTHAIIAAALVLASATGTALAAPLRSYYGAPTRAACGPVPIPHTPPTQI